LFFFAYEPIVASLTMIQSEPENIEQIREHIRKMSDSNFLWYVQTSPYV